MLEKYGACSFFAKSDERCQTGLVMHVLYILNNMFKKLFSLLGTLLVHV